MMWLLGLLVPVASAVDVEVRHGGYVFRYAVEVGEQVTETWHGLPRRAAEGRRRRGRIVDYRISIAVRAAEGAADGAEREPALAVDVELVEIDGRHERVVTRPTLIAREGQIATLFSGSELPIRVSSSWDGESGGVRMVEVADVEVVVGALSGPLGLGPAR